MNKSNNKTPPGKMNEDIVICEKKASCIREKLENDLRKMIRNNQFDALVPIPSETEMVKRYGLCRNTIRKVLQTLLDEGLLYKRRGKGTFIVPQETRPLESTRLNKLLIIIPDYNESTRQLSSYDRCLLAGISDYAFQNHGKLELRAEGDSAERLLDQYRNLKFDGIIWDRPPHTCNNIIEKLHHHKVPQVTISQTVSGVPSLFFDYRKGIQDVVHFLYNIGHTRIIFIDLPKQAPIFTNRQHVFMDELRAIGISDPEKFVYTMTFKGKQQSDVSMVFKEHPSATAVFCSAPLIRELWKRLQEHGCKIPEKLSLITLGESQEYLPDSAISSLCEPRQKIGWTAAELISLQRAGKKISDDPVFLAGELLIRKSCSSPFLYFQKSRLTEFADHDAINAVLI